MTNDQFIWILLGIGGALWVLDFLVIGLIGALRDYRQTKDLDLTTANFVSLSKEIEEAGGQAAWLEKLSKKAER